MPFIIIGVLILIGIIVVYRSKTRQSSSSHATSNDYRSNEEDFGKTLLTRNRRRNRIGENYCIVCGEYFGSEVSQFDPQRRHGGLCKHCNKWMQAEFRKEYGAATQKDPQLFTMQERIVRCLMIALDANDGIITEACAKADIDTAKYFEDEKLQRISDNKNLQEKKEDSQRLQQASDRKSADETLRRLL